MLKAVLNLFLGSLIGQSWRFLPHAYFELNLAMVYIGHSIKKPVLVTQSISPLSDGKLLPVWMILDNLSLVYYCFIVKLLARIWRFSFFWETSEIWEKIVYLEAS